MDITNLAFPSSVTAGSLQPTAVTVAIPYTDAKPGYWLMVGITDLKLNGTIVSGNAIGSPAPCLNQPMAQAICQAQLQAESGVENVQFKIGGIFANTKLPPGIWKLQVKAEILDSNSTVLSRSTVSFAIDLAPILLTLEIPDNATFWVDGNASTGGTIPVALGRHSIAVPMFVTINDTVRMRFDSWADGSTQPNRTLLVSSNEKLRVVYYTQYRLTINTDEPGSSAAGAGWYDNGSLASFSVGETQSSTGGILDLLGARMSFQGWFEDGKPITENPSGSIEMNASHAITAEWTTDYSIPIIFFVLVMASGLGVYFMVKRASHKTKKTPQRRRSRLKKSKASNNLRKA